MGVSRIEQLIDDIYEFVESCKMSPLSQTKVIVPKDELYDLLDELKLRTPDEIKRYQKIISNRDSILADAEKRAEEIKEAARQQAIELVNNNDIMRQVYQQANDMLADANGQAEMIIGHANEDADQIRSGALVYTNEMLANAERILRESYESTETRMNMLVSTLKSSLDTVIENRREINGQLGSQAEDNDYGIPEDEFDFPEDKFLEDIDYTPSP